MGAISAAPGVLCETLGEEAELIAVEPPAQAP